MSDEQKRQLERQLADLSQWRGGKTQLWRKALEQAERESAEKAGAGDDGSPLRRIFLWRIPPAIGAAAAAVIVVAIAAALLVPGMQHARDQAVSYSLEMPVERRAPVPAQPQVRTNLRNLQAVQAMVEVEDGGNVGMIE